MKKKVNNLIVPTLIIVGFLFIFLIINFTPTGKVIEEPPTLNNCSEEEIKGLWEFVFKGDSDNLTIDIKSDSYELLNQTVGIFQITGCPEYEIYQITGTKVRTLRRAEGFYPGNNEIVWAFEVEFKPERIEDFKLFLENLTEEAFYYPLYINSSDLSLREINTLEEAEAEFESIFKINSSNWTLDQEFGSDTYLFTENETMKNLTVFGQSINPLGNIANIGSVVKNYSMASYMYVAGASLGQAEYVSKKYENWTSFINTTIEGITIKINNSEISVADFLWSQMLGPDENPLGVQKLEILQNNKVIIETEINFTQSMQGIEFLGINTVGIINYTDIILRKQPSTHEIGYVIINGINESKNVTVDKLSSKSDSVCIKNSEITFISEISEDCGDSDEILLDCPGEQEGYTCQIINNTFFVTGLMHSAVSEYLEKEPCIPQWDCDTWSNSKEQCGYRICSDLNQCRNLTGMPDEYKKCPPICIPNWECSDWEPEKCPKEEQRTRICEDLNDCGKNNERPNTSMLCAYENNTLLWISLGILVLLLALLLVIGLTSSRKTKRMQKETHNPHPENEIHEHELPDEQDFSENKINSEFQEFKQNKRLQEPIRKPTQEIQKQKKQLPKQHELPKKYYKPKNRGDFYLP